MLLGGCVSWQCCYCVASVGGIAVVLLCVAIVLLISVSSQKARLKRATRVMGSAA